MKDFLPIFLLLVSLTVALFYKDQPETKEEILVQTEKSFYEPKFSKQETSCLALNIYFEARGEPITGQLAVGLVTLNRVNSTRYPNNICDVVYQHRQFSWYWDGKSDLPKDLALFEEIWFIAQALTDNDSAILDFTKGSLWYHADYVDPTWNRAMVKTTQINSHIFYR